MKKVSHLLICAMAIATNVFSQTKSDSTNTQTTNIKIKGLDKTAGKPIYTIDGIKQFNDLMIKSINPDEIKEIIVIKGDNAINLFGLEGSSGAVVITTKAKSNSTENIELRSKMSALGIINGMSKSTDFASETKQKNDSISAFTFNTSKFRIRGLNNPDKINQPLYIVDGEKIESGSIEFLDPNTIDSVTILKDTNAIQSYGLAASNGVVIIKTKPSKKLNKVIEQDKN